MTDTSSSAGWHIDPNDRTLYRYHDGSVWTDHTAPAVVSPTPVPPAAPLPPAPAPAAVAQPVAVAPYATTPVYSTVVAPAYIGYLTGQPGISPKSWTTAWLLSLFLGGWGVDRFYLGNTGMGVAKLLVGWLTLGIWPLIDFIVIVSKNAHDGMGLRVVAEPGQLGLVSSAGGVMPGGAAAAGMVPDGPAGPTKTLSIVSMVLSLVAVPLSFISVGVLAAIAGVIVGFIAARREPYAKGFWLTGIIVGGVIVVLVLASLLIRVIASAISAAQYNNSY